MKKQINYLMMPVVLAVAGLFSSCTPDDYSLASPAIIPAELVEGIAYTVTPDPNNPNIIFCKSDLGAGRSVAWQTPFGLSRGNDVTLQMPFAGDYEVKFGIDTGNGFVWGEPYKFTIADICTDFISGEVWTQLAGGVGKSKTWVYDNGACGYSAGPLSYGDPAANPNLGFNSFTENWTPGASEDPCADPNMWGSYMTFDLINGAHYSWYDSSTGASQEGTYSLNDQAYTLDFVNAELMHPSSWGQRLLDWRKDFKIIELSVNHMRVAYVRVPGNWGDEWVECFNYVAKDYLDSYEPPLPSGIKVDPELLAALATEMKYATWKFDEEVPFDWFTIDGQRKNPGWTTASSYPAAYTPIVDNYADYQLKFCTPAANDYTAGSEKGTFTMSDNGLLQLSDPITEYIGLASTVSFHTSADRTLQVLDGDIDDQGRVTELWLGAMEKDITGNDIEYIGYHFVASYGTGSSTPSYGMTLNYNDMGTWSMQTGPTVYTTGDGTYELTLSGSNSNMDPMLWIDCNKILTKYPNCDIIIKSISIDGKNLDFVDSDISRSAGDSENIARRYICNPWGLAACFNGDMTVFLFKSEIRVTVEVRYDTGTPFIR